MSVSIQEVHVESPIVSWIKHELAAKISVNGKYNAIHQNIFYYNVVLTMNSQKYILFCYCVTN